MGKAGTSSGRGQRSREVGTGWVLGGKVGEGNSRESLDPREMWGPAFDGCAGVD